MSRHPAPRLAAGALGLLLLTELLLRGAAGLATPVTFDSGPNTGSHVAGFTPSEEHLPLTLRWSRARASVELPLVAPAGQATLTLRAARFVDWPARIRVFVGGEPAGVFTAPPGGFKLHRLPFRHPGGPLEIDLLSDDPELGVALDWLRIEGLAARLPPAVWQPRLLPVGALLLAWLAGFGLAGALGAGAATALALAAFAGADPFGAAHALPRIALPGLALAALPLAALRRLPGSRWLPLIVLGSFLAKGAALFHPSYFYGDVRQNHRYVRALAEAEGETLERRNRAAQVEVGVAYPRVVAGKRYAFPYSPVFYLPFTALDRSDDVVEAIKLVALAAAGAEALAVAWLAGLLGGGRFAVLAALISTGLPPVFNRMLFAMWSTVTAHLLDLVAVCAVALLAARPASRGRALLVWAAIQASLLCYVSSLFNLAALVAFASLLDRRLARRLLPLWLLATATTVLWLYRDFTLLFLTEILPAALAGGGSGKGEAGGALAALGRIVIFYGPLTPLVAAAGLAVLRRTAPAEERRVAWAYALAVTLLLGLRAFGGGLLKDLKELELAAPLVAVATAAALDGLRRGGRSARLLARLLLAATLAFGAVAGWQDFARHSRLIGL